jgi:hypothetical protein
MITQKLVPYETGLLPDKVGSLASGNESIWAIAKTEPDASLVTQLSKVRVARSTGPEPYCNARYRTAAGCTRLWQAARPHP